VIPLLFRGLLSPERGEESQPEGVLEAAGCRGWRLAPGTLHKRTSEFTVEEAHDGGPSSPTAETTLA